MYNPSKRISRIDETFSTTLPWGTIVLHQASGRIAVLDRPVEQDESLQSVGLTVHGLDVPEAGVPAPPAGTTIYITWYYGGWKSSFISPIPVPPEPRGPIALGVADFDTFPVTIRPDGSDLQVGDFYTTILPGKYKNFSKAGYHWLQGYFYRNYIPSEDYVADEIVYYDGNIYLCITNISNAPSAFPHDHFQPLNTGNMFTDESTDLDTFDGDYYHLATFDKATAVQFNIAFNKDHVISMVVNSTGQINILSSSWESIPYIKEMHLDDVTGDAYNLIIMTCVDSTDVRVKINGYALTSDAMVEAERPILDYPTLWGAFSSIYNLNKGIGALRSGMLVSGEPTYYIDYLGNPVKIDFAHDDPGILVNKKYVDDELTKEKTLISTFNPNNAVSLPAPPPPHTFSYLGWVDSDLNAIPDPTILNKGHYYVISANSVIEAGDVSLKANTQWAGSNSTDKTKFIIPAVDAHQYFVPQISTRTLVRVFMRKGGTHITTDPYDWYSTDMGPLGATFDGTNTIVDLLEAPREALTDDYHTIYIYVPWPMYAATEWLPPEGTGLLTNHTIISTGTAHVYPSGSMAEPPPLDTNPSPPPPQTIGGMSSGNYGTGGWKLLESGVESIAERVLTEVNLANHGFTEGQQVYLGSSSVYSGTNTTQATFVMDAKYPDLTTRGVLVGDDVVVLKADGTSFSSAVKTIAYTGGQNTILLDPSPPSNDFTSLRNTEVRWRLAISDHVVSLKMGYVDNQFRTSANHFYLVMYGIIEWPSTGAGHGYIIGDFYYLSDTLIGETQTNPPTNIGTYRQACFEVLDQYRIKVLDWEPHLNSLPALDTARLVEVDETLTVPTTTLNLLTPLYETAAGTWSLAQADTATTMKVGFFLQNKAGGLIDVIIYGMYEHPVPPAPVHGFTVGSTYYLDTLTAGNPVAIPPAPRPGLTDIVQELFHVLSPDNIKIFDKGLSSGSVIADWLVTSAYSVLGEMVTLETSIYINLNPIGNTAMRPNLNSSRTFWRRLTTRVFPSENDPHLAANGDNQVINGDRWISYEAIPSGVYVADTAPLSRIRQGTNWMLVNSGTVVVADADNWGTTDKSTAMVLVEKHITHPEVDENAIDLGFKSRGGNWLRAKLWQMPWGQIHRFNWSGSFYAWNNHNWHRVFLHTWNSGSTSTSRRWKVTATIDVNCDANNTNAIYRVDCNGETKSQSLYINSDTTPHRQLTFIFYQDSKVDFSMESFGAWESGGATKSSSGFVVIEDVGFVRN